jgi:hypothetical protein
MAQEEATLETASDLSEGVSYEKVDDQGALARGAGESVSMGAVREVWADVGEETQKDTPVITPEDSETLVEKTERDELDPIGDDDAKEKEPAQKADDSEAESGDEEEEAPEEGVQEVAGKQNWKERKITFVDADGNKQKMSNNAIIQVTVNGKKIKMPLQEALNRASGDVSIEQKIVQEQQRAQQRETAWQKHQAEWAEKQKIVDDTNTTHKEILRLATEGSPEDLLIYAARKSGQDPLKVIEKFAEDTMASASTFAQMSPEQRAVWLDSFKTLIERQDLAEERKKLNDDKATREAEVAQQGFEAFARGEMAKFSVTEDDLVNTVQLLQQKGVDLPNDSQQDRLDVIFDYIHEQRIYRAAQEVDPELLKNVPLLQEVYDLTANGHKIRTVEKLKEVLERFSDNNGVKNKKRIAQNLSRKELNGSSQRQPKQTDDEDDGPMGFNDFRRRHHGQ